MSLLIVTTCTNPFYPVSSIKNDGSGPSGDTGVDTPGDTGIGTPVDPGVYIKNGTQWDPVPGFSGSFTNETLGNMFEHINTSDTSVSSIDYLLVIDADIPDAAPRTLGPFSGVERSLAIRGADTEQTIALDSSSSGSLVTIKSGAELILENKITLKGKSDNTAALVWVKDGGALTTRAGSKITGNTNIREDEAEDKGRRLGGGVHMDGTGSLLAMEGGEISGNYASYGGGIDVTSGRIIMESGSVITGNFCNRVDGTGGLGAGVYLRAGGGSLTMETGSLITNNTADGNGGGVYLATGTSLTMQGDSKITGNTSGGGWGGGGVFLTGSTTTFTMHDGEIANNNASNGGGVSIDTGGTFIMNGGSIAANPTASNGGGVYIRNGGSLTMNNNAAITSHNLTSDKGGGVYLASGNLTMNGNAKITGNTASGDGGGVYKGTQPGAITMNGGEISNNQSTGGSGGGVCVEGGTFTKSGVSTIFGHNGGADSNTAAGGGDAVYVATGPYSRNTTAGPGVDLNSDGTPTENWGL